MPDTQRDDKGKLAGHRASKYEHAMFQLKAGSLVTTAALSPFKGLWLAFFAETLPDKGNYLEVWC
jgi:hypothetical protein